VKPNLNGKDFPGKKQNPRYVSPGYSKNSVLRHNKIYSLNSQPAQGLSNRILKIEKSTNSSNLNLPEPTDADTRMVDDNYVQSKLSYLKARTNNRPKQNNVN